jgi:hypothetical protein
MQMMGLTPDQFYKEMYEAGFRPNSEIMIAHLKPDSHFIAYLEDGDCDGGTFEVVFGKRADQLARSFRLN